MQRELGKKCENHEGKDCGALRDYLGLEVDSPELKLTIFLRFALHIVTALNICRMVLLVRKPQPI